MKHPCRQVVVVRHVVAVIVMAVALLVGVMACTSPPPSIRSAVLCRDLTDDGEPVGVVEAFQPMDTFCLSLEMSGPPRDAEVTTTWFFRDRYLRHLPEPVARGEGGSLGFQLTQGYPWDMGDYRVEVFVAGERVETLHFRVSPPEDAIPSRVNSAVVASRLDEEGRAVDPRTAFSPSDSIRCVVGADLGVYSKIEVQWYAGERLLQHSHQTSASSNVENGYYDFPLDTGERLALGEYRADVYVDGLLGQSLLFRIEETTDQDPIIGLVAFAEAVDEGGQPVCPRIVFPPGTMAVYAVYEFSGMQNGVECQEVWLLNGEEEVSESYQWAEGAQGQSWAKLGSREELSPGDYELRIYVEGKLLRRGHFSVEAGDLAGLLFSDDFSDLESGWGEISVEAGSSAYGTGIFCVRVDNAEWVVWSTAGQEFDDFVVEADAWQASGPGDASYGILVRYEDSDHFYRFDVGGDQQYSVSKSMPEEWVDIVDWAESLAILPNRGVNHIRVRCQGSEMSLYINGEHLVTVEDESFSKGDIGLFGATFDEGGAVLCFDNVKVWRLTD